jgi:hypothetical protein
MKIRDTFMDLEYWNWVVESYKKSISKYEDIIVSSEITAEHRRKLLYVIFKERLELLNAQYSRGDDIDSIAALFPMILDSLEKYQKQPYYEPFDFNVLEQYIQALWLVSLSILLKMPIQISQRVIRLVNSSGEDAIYNILAQNISTDHGFQNHNNLIHPNPYRSLYQSINAPVDHQIEFILQFLKKYYPGIRKVYWYNRHLKPRVGFFGYWCFELAAIIKTTNISDHLFIDNIYYPADILQRD